MRKRLLAALIGVGAGIFLLGAYFALSSTGIHLRPEVLVASAAALAFAATVAVFALLAMERPSQNGARAVILLNEEPATKYVYSFRPGETIAITALPDKSVGEMLVRYGAVFSNPPAPNAKPITLTIKGSAKKPFASVTLQQLFLMLKPFPLEHVLLMSEKDEFVGYIPGKRALREFTQEKGGIENIDKFIVKVLAKPSDSTILREIGGLTSDDTVGEGDDTARAESKIWANENVQGLVIHRRLKPIGYISKVDVLRLNAGRL